MSGAQSSSASHAARRAMAFALGASIASSGAAKAEVPARSADGGLPGSPATTSPASTDVSTEPPYEVGRRPRPGGAVQASVADEWIARWNAGGCGAPTCASNRPGFHPAPRVKVDTIVRSGRLPERSKAPKGVLSEVGVLAQTRSSGYWPFRLCFEGGLRRTPKLSGKTRVRIVIASDGRVTSSRVMESDLEDREVTTCLATRAHGLHFAPPPRRRADVEITVDLTPGDAPLPDAIPTRAETTLDHGPTKLDGDFAPAAVEAALLPLVPACSACYAEGRAKDPRLWGRLALRFDMDSRGTIQGVAQHDSRFPDPAVTACVLSAARAAAFPRPASGPLRFVWAVRFGGGPPQESARNPPPESSGKSRVAELPSTRVRLGE